MITVGKTCRLYLFNVIVTKSGTFCEVREIETNRVSQKLDILKVEQALSLLRSCQRVYGLVAMVQKYILSSETTSKCGRTMGLICLKL